MVIVLGSISVIVFGLCVGPIGGWIDKRISRGAAALLALISKCYRFRTPVRDVKVSKQTGDLVGLGIHRVNCVATVGKGSLCEDLIFPGDMIHSINGHSLTNSVDASAKIREARELHFLVSSPPSADNEATERRMLHAKLVVAYVASQCVIGLCALVAYANPEPVHEGWDGFDYYYFAFVTVSSIGFGDFAMGPKEGTLLGFIRLFTQATTIFVGMAFFNSLTGVGGDWASDAAERTLSCLAQHVPPLCDPGAMDAKGAEPVGAERDKVHEVHGQSELASDDAQHAAPPAEIALARALATSRTVTRFGARLKRQHAAPPPASAEIALAHALQHSRMANRFGAQLKLQEHSVKKFGARAWLKRSKTAKLLEHALDHAALNKLLDRLRLRRLAKATNCLLPWLVLFFAMMLLGGYIFMSIEAEHESIQAQALRNEENAIRAVAGIELKGAQSNALSVHQAANASVISPDAVRAQLLVIGSMPEEAQAAAVEEVVSEFTEVVAHESGCDRLADLTVLMLSQCKSRPPSPISLNWSFNGAAFFMLTIMTTIGYGVCAHTHACMHVHTYKTDIGNGALPAESNCELLATLPECPC